MAAGARRGLWLLLLLGLALRLAYALPQPTLSQYFHAGGGDAGWYLANGWGLLSGQEHGSIRGIPFYSSVIPTPPLYLLFTGLVQQVFPDHETILAIRALQCLASIATAWIAGRLGALVSGDERVGVLAAGLAALHPALIVDPAHIATETLYIFFIALSLWLYAESAVAATELGRSWLKPGHALSLSAAALALATLTRAVAALFPLAIALHLFILSRRGLVASWKRKWLLFIAVFALVVSAWTLHNLLLWGRLVLVSDQFVPALWRGVESQDGSPQENDAILLGGAQPPKPEGCLVDCKYHHPTELYLNRIRQLAGADLGGILARRVTELAHSLLQPHGTTHFGDESVREAALRWLGDDRSVAGLGRLLNIEGFFIKLLTWVFHYAALVFGVMGIFLSRPRWAVALPIASFALYTLLAHLVLLSLPRYIFPIEVFMLAFAAVALVDLADKWRAKRG